jgi:hypothetical protein
MSQCRNLADYAVILNENDNVATALIDSSEDRTTITVSEDIRAGFKIALSDISKSEPVYKYGYIIGLAITDIEKGDCVHIHNLISSV